MLSNKKLILPCYLRFFSVSKRMIRELRTMFQRNGERTPPCGVPARIQMMSATPLRLSLSFLVDMW